MVLRLQSSAFNLCKIQKLNANRPDPTPWRARRERSDSVMWTCQLPQKAACGLVTIAKLKNL